MLEVKIRTGHYREFIRAGTGEVVFVPLSTSFDDMDEGEFIEWSGRAKRVIFDELLREFKPADLRRLDAEIERWTAWT